MKRLLLLCLLLASVFAASLGTTFEIDLGDPITLSGSNFALVSVNVSFMPGQTSFIVVDVDDEEHTIDFLGYVETDGFTIKWTDTMVGTGATSAYLHVTEIVSISLDTSFTLNTKTTPKARYGSMMIELTETYQSSLPGVPSTATVKIDGSEETIAIGGNTTAGDYILSAESISFGSPDDVTFLLSSPPAEEAPEVTPTPTPEPTPTATPEPTPTPEPDSGTSTPQAIGGTSTPTPTPAPMLIAAPRAIRAVPVAIVAPVASSTAVTAKIQATRIAETTSQVRAHSAAGNKITYQVEGNATSQGYLQVSNAPRKPKQVKFDGAEIPECSVSLLQTCITAILGGGATEDCLCWTYNEADTQVEIFYPHSEHTIEIDFGEEGEAATPTPTPEPTPTPTGESPTGDSPSGSDGESTDGGSTLLYIVVALVIIVLAAGAFFFLRKKKPPAPELDYTKESTTQLDYSSEE